jgi:serine phosphatase RsbU (regulator of sigma subunit)
MQQAEAFRTSLTLKTKFLIWLIVFVLVISLLFYGFFVNHEGHMITQQIRLRGETIGKSLAAGAEDFLIMKDDLALAKLVYDTKEENPGVVGCFVVDADQVIWAHTDIRQVTEIYHPPPGLQPLGGRLLSTQDYRFPDGMDALAIAVAMEVSKNKIGEAHVVLSKQDLKTAVQGAQRGAAVIGAIILAIGVSSILILVSLIIGSLGAVTDDIEAIGNGDLDRMILTTRRDEVGRIAHAVKIMAQNLRKAQNELVEKERMKKEMQIAKEIQHALLPMSNPVIPGYAVDSFYEAAMEVGGDYHDFVVIDKEHMGFVIADVSGKGIAGSLVMTMLRSFIRNEAPHRVSPRDLLLTINDMLSRDIPEGMYITMFYVVLDLARHELTYCCAGHNPVYYYNAQTRSITSLKPGGPPLGVDIFDARQFSAQLQEEKKIMQEGDIVFLYTDGVTEAMNSRREQFGTRRLEALLQQNGHLAPDRFSHFLKLEIETFTGNAPQSDDIAYVVLKRL